MKQEGSRKHSAKRNSASRLLVLLATLGLLSRCGGGDAGPVVSGGTAGAGAGAGGSHAGAGGVGAGGAGTGGSGAGGDLAGAGSNGGGVREPPLGGGGSGAGGSDGGRADADTSQLSPVGVALPAKPFLTTGPASFSTVLSKGPTLVIKVPDGFRVLDPADPGNGTALDIGNIGEKDSDGGALALRSNPDVLLYWGSQTRVQLRRDDGAGLVDANFAAADVAQSVRAVVPVGNTVLTDGFLIVDEFRGILFFAWRPTPTGPPSGYELVAEIPTGTGNAATTDPIVGAYAHTSGGAVLYLTASTGFGTVLYHSASSLMDVVADTLVDAPDQLVCLVPVCVTTHAASPTSSSSFTLITWDGGTNPQKPGGPRTAEAFPIPADQGAPGPATLLAFGNERLVLIELSSGNLLLARVTADGSVAGSRYIEAASLNAGCSEPTSPTWLTNTAEPAFVLVCEKERSILTVTPTLP